MNEKSTSNITLCLSGGGFRATIYHIGVLAALRSLNLLRNVERIVSVSGGSITAAHATLNWSRYTGQSEEDYRDAVRELIALVRSDVRGRIVRRWLLLGYLPGFGRTQLLEKCYDDFFRKNRLEDLRNKDPHGFGRYPALYIATTSLVSGQRCYFSNAGLHIGTVAASSHAIRMPSLSIARAVAASSAFPAMFPPVVLDPAKLGVNLPAKERLTDAGVFDNLGIAAALELDADAPIFVSDASASFSNNSWDTYNWIVGRTMRTTDVQMARIAQLDKQSALASSSKRNIYFTEISSTVSDAQLRDTRVFVLEPVALSETLQHWVRLVRTDLDEFSTHEIDAIYRHGYATAMCSFSKHAIKHNNYLSIEAGMKWRPTSSREADRSIMVVQKPQQSIWDQLKLGAARPDTPKEEEASLKAGSTRRWRIWNSQDAFCWCALTVFAAICVAIGRRFLPHL